LVERRLRRLVVGGRLVDVFKSGASDVSPPGDDAIVEGGVASATLLLADRKSRAVPLRY
jgi:hypothetical protein